MIVSKKKLAQMQSDIRKEYEEQLSQKKEAIDELKAENRSLRAELGEYKAREKHISESIIAAEQKSDEIRQLMHAYAEKQIAGLSLYADRCKRFALGLQEKYGDEADVAEFLQFTQKMVSLFPDPDCAEEVPDEDSEFDINEVLNPSQEPDLELLCTELGLMRGEKGKKE